MARIISDILNVDTVQFNHLIEDWERRTGRRGHDLTLYSDMRTRAVSAIKLLGLDPSDTIEGELYYAIQERARNDTIWLAKHLGIKPSDTPENMLETVVSWVVENAENTSVWGCKQAVIRTYLKKQPPKSVMKALGLRSVDSMLKRNSAAEIIILANELESPEWNVKFKNNYKKCTTADFDERQIQFLTLTADRQEKLKKTNFPLSRLVSPNFELGTALLSPAPYRFPLDVLAAVVSIAEVIYEMRKHSALYRTLSVRKDFPLQLYAIVTQGVSKASLSISDIGWNSLHKHLVGNEYVLSRLEQPHVTEADMSAESSIRFLTKRDSRFEYWRDLDYAIYTGTGRQPVSLNIVDVVTNASNRIPYTKGSVSYARMRLWEELWARYLASDHVIEDVIDSYLK